MNATKLFKSITKGTKVMKKQAGFTLVEIAIVLVIIGLLLGGVLKGQEIIINAKVINVENSFTGISSAIYSYQDRYRALPGDDKEDKTVVRWGAGVKGGDNDGRIEGKFDGAGEPEYFWLHLRNAKLVAGAVDDSSHPTNAFGGLVGACSENGANISGIHVGFQNMPGKIVSILESRSDDSDPAKGGIQAAEGPNYSAATAYDDSKDYNVFFEL